MLVLGLLLVLGAAVIAVGAVFDAGEEATVEILGQVITTTAAGVFVAGAVTMLMFLVGVWAIMGSMSRTRRKRVERREAKARQRDSVAQLEEERSALRAENERLSEQLATTRTDARSTDHLPRTDTTHDTAGGTSNDRVIDHSTDLHATETSPSGRHRDEV